MSITKKESPQNGSAANSKESTHLSAESLPTTPRRKSQNPQETRLRNLEKKKKRKKKEKRKSKEKDEVKQKIAELQAKKSAALDSPDRQSTIKELDEEIEHLKLAISTTDKDGGNNEEIDVDAVEGKEELEKAKIKLQFQLSMEPVEEDNIEEMSVTAREKKFGLTIEDEEPRQKLQNRLTDINKALDDLKDCKTRLERLVEQVNQWYKKYHDRIVNLENSMREFATKCDVEKKDMDSELIILEDLCSRNLDLRLSIQKKYNINGQPTPQKQTFGMILACIGVNIARSLLYNSAVIRDILFKPPSSNNSTAEPTLNSQSSSKEPLTSKETVGGVQPSSANPTPSPPIQTTAQTIPPSQTASMSPPSPLV